MKLLSWALTDVGLKRDHNEDAYLVDPELNLYAVADGMGGHAGGNQASHLAIDELRMVVEEGDPEGLGRKDEAACALMREAARRAGRRIFRAARDNPELKGMGTTLTSLLFYETRVCMAHVGDSRAYLYRDGRVSQISQDHSWIQEQVRAGLLTESEAKTSRLKHIITRSVGFEEDVQVDTLSMPVLMGDCFLLCSDGLSNYLSDEELGALMSSTFYAKLPSVLVDLAKDRGGDDNITVVVVYAANDTDSR